MLNSSKEKMYRQCLQSIGLIIPREAARNISATTVTLGFHRREKFGGKWRISQGQARDGAQYGPLTDLPDYTFLDGRPTPLSVGQVKRREQNRKLTESVMTLLDEVKFTKDYYAQRMQEEKEHEEVMVKRRFKKKGNQLDYKAQKDNDQLQKKNFKPDKSSS